MQIFRRDKGATVITDIFSLDISKDPVEVMPLEKDDYR